VFVRSTAPRTARRGVSHPLFCSRKERPVFDEGKVQTLLLALFGVVIIGVGVAVGLPHLPIWSSTMIISGLPKD
jgi:hypothetical protein